MANINFVVPALSRHKFSGGILCIMQYASYLTDMGHNVNVIPIFPCTIPAWWTSPATVIVPRPIKTMKVIMESFTIMLTTIISKGARSDTLRCIARECCNITESTLPYFRYILAYPAMRGVSLAYMRKQIPNADITIATSFETAMPVALYGKGHRYYFMQHFEPYFSNEYQDPYLAEKEAKLSYRLGLIMVANSSWLKSTIEQEFPEVTVNVCNNAIDHGTFNGIVKTNELSNEVKVISYGGRNAEWKGFKDMAHAIQKARSALPNRRIRWLVYGDALLPPDNSVASYEHLGFLSQRELAAAYREADILLSASWYESFPLFPLEAMACGLPVITTPIGTEEYAILGKTAEVVPPRDPMLLASSLVKLINDDQYRVQLAEGGRKMSQSFSWDISARKLEQLILGPSGR
jgi:glycosyltransferase involved in cell wall biosynthesis